MEQSWVKKCRVHGSGVVYHDCEGIEERTKNVGRNGHELPEHLHPVHEVSVPIYDRFVLSFCQLFYAFSIPKPAYISKVCGCRIN